jgi:hypothetical protein
MSLDEWFEKYEATRILRENLETNLKAIAGQLTEKQREILMRVNLTVIRQCLQDCGLE